MGGTMYNWLKDSNRKAVAVVRRSSQGQKGNTSGDSQECDIQDYCKRYKLDLVKIEPIIETAYRSGERKKYNSILEHALANGIRHILFSLSDREARNLSDNEKNEELILADKIVIHHVSEGKVFHKETPDGDFLLRDINASINKHYSRANGTKMKRAYRTKAENGWYPFRHTPLGYYHKKELDQYNTPIKGTAKLSPVPDSKMVDQVNREFALRAEGYSYDQIADIMFNEGWIHSTTKSGYRATISKRLLNPLYWGHFYLDGVRHEGKHELIIPRNILEKVKAINEGNPNRPTRPFNPEGILGGGWLRCGNPECGLTIIFDPKTKKIKSTGKEKTYDYYRCTNRRKIHPKHKYAEESKLLKQFEPSVESFEISEEFANDILNVLNDAHKKELEAIRKQAEGHREALRGLEGKEDSILDLFKDGAIDRETCNRKFEQIRKERDHFNRRLEQLNIMISDAGHAAVKEVFELAKNVKSEWKRMNPQEKVSMLKRVCSNPTLDGLTLHYQLKSPFARLANWSGNTEWRARVDEFRTECFQMAA